jgi:nicotinamide-nucleotide amidase
MARGVAKRCNADWGLATTGVAGPEPQNGHHVGQVFVAVSHPATKALRVEELLLHGDRAMIRRQAASAALELLADALGLTGVGLES